MAECGRTRSDVVLAEWVAIDQSASGRSRPVSNNRLTQQRRLGRGGFSGGKRCLLATRRRV